MKVFYHPKQSAQNDKSFSPSAGKPEIVIKDWQTNLLPIEIVSFDPLSIEDICLAHEESFVRGILAGEIPNGFKNTNLSVAESLPYTSGSFYHGAVAAIKDKSIVCSPTSGFHHAKYEKADGFCTFNGLVITARKLVEQDKLVSKVAILDIDRHAGDGTSQIIRKLNLNYINHWSFGAKMANPNFLPEFFKKLEEHLESIKDVGIILYQAGADPHINDPLGGFLSTEDLKKRDEMVFSFAKRNNIPVVWNLAGGYQDLNKLLEIHRNTLLAATS